jgi:hypothetical protein
LRGRKPEAIPDGMGTPPVVIPAYAGIQDRPPRGTRGHWSTAGRDAGATLGSESGVTNDRQSAERGISLPAMTR